MPTDARTRYSTIAIILHWTIAALIVANLVIGRLNEGMSDAARAFWMGQHYAIGMTVLFLSMLRLLWRLIHPVPPANPAHPAWERLVAKTVHFLFYALMIAMPMIGWLIKSTGRGDPINIFGLFDVPALPTGHSESAHQLFETLHGIGGWMFIGLIALHIVGALKHHIIDKDSTLGRMIPFRSLLARGE